MKRMTGADKQAYMKGLASQAETAANRGGGGGGEQVYKITKLVSGKYMYSVYHGATKMPIVD